MAMQTLWIRRDNCGTLLPKNWIRYSLNQTSDKEITMGHNIYALLVGITDYDPAIVFEGGAVSFPKLYGCVNDAEKFDAFLQGHYEPEHLFIKKLYNKAARKGAICAAFSDHLGKAGKGDKVIFYFSGHGTQEAADLCWKT